MVSLPDKYTYRDAKDGTKYSAHTCTDDGDEGGTRESGADLRFVIMDGGDHTRSHKTINDPTSKNRGALGTSRV